MTEHQIAIPKILRGRGAELAAIAAALADPAVRAVVATGPEDVGKTALLTESLGRAAADGALTGVGKHADGETDVSPFVQAMEHAVAAGLDQLYDPNAGLETLASALGGAASVFAARGSGVLRSLKGNSAAPRISPEAADERIVHACATVLRWLHGFDQPIVLQIDDWGRAGERAMRLYERLIADPRLPRLRFLASERPEQASVLSSSPGSARIPVGPIGVEARLAIIADILGQTRDGDQTLGGLEPRGGGGAHWAREPVAGALPESTAIRLIADQPEALAIAQTLSVVGNSADAEDLGASCGMSSTETATAIAVLEARGLAHWQGPRLALTDDQLRRALLQTLTVGALRAVSAKIAQTLLERGAAADADPGAVVRRQGDVERLGEAAPESRRKLGGGGAIADRDATAPASGWLAEVEALKAAVRALEQRQAERERELETAREAAERANRAKSRFLAAIGHELRTPLQGLVGMIDLARESGETLDARTLGSVIGQFRTVVNDLTDLGALEGGVFALAERPFDPAETCRAVVKLHEPSLAGLARAIHLMTPARGIFVLGDEARVGQVLSNLIGNAVKHAQGDIDVRLGVRRSGRTASITIDVADEGPGLDEAALARLFEPFERGAGAETTEGLGLGLPLSRALARRMGGDILVRKTAGAGASFELAFEAPIAQRPEETANGDLTGLRVLLAENAALGRRVIASLFCAHGCLVQEAADGQAALDLWQAGDFDLVMLDLRMPTLDGLEVARTIRAKEAGRGGPMPIVVATAASGGEVAEAAAAIGVTVLQKPIGWHDIAKAVGVASATPAADRLAELREALGADAEGLFAEAAQSTATLASEIAITIDAGDIVAAKRQAHRLAGLASNFGLDAVAAAALALEAETMGGAVSAEAVARLVCAASSVTEPADA